MYASRSMTIDFNAHSLFSIPSGKPAKHTEVLSSPDHWTSASCSQATSVTSPAKSAMPSHGFVGQQLPQSIRSAASSSAAIHRYDRDAATEPVGTPFSAAASRQRQLLISCLPADTTADQLRLMLLFSQELLDIEMLPMDSSKNNELRSALVTFSTPAAAQQAKDMLHGKALRPNETELVVEVMAGSPPIPRRYPVEDTVSAQPNGPSSIAAPGPPLRHPIRFNGLERITPPLPPPALQGTNDLTDPEYYHNIFSAQSPIGNHLANQTHSLGKTLIHNTADDDETRELLKDPVAYAENGATQQRRATAPQLPIPRLANLSLNTSTNGTTPMTPSPYGHSGMTPLSAHGNSMSPTHMNGVNHSVNYQMSSYNRLNFPPVNPADQNPPCNTLYVGNLPIDTSEEELKVMFQKQRGYKRLCFRTKQNGPMCFVEFEDVTHATRALHELYGKLLHNSVKGGIRLSFSKNPLGVRNPPPALPANGAMGSMNGVMAASGNGFPITNRPPPGLTTPPGLNTRLDMNGNGQMTPNGVNTASTYLPSNGYIWCSPPYPTASSSSPPNGSASGYMPPFQPGR